MDDYGIYGVVGSFVSMFSIVTSSLNGAISRFLNFAMGKGDKEELAKTFSLSLTIMVILSAIVVLLTETFGLWFLYNRMTIPPDRLNAAFWCFQFSVLSSISSFLVVSFTASIIAHEKMGVFAYIDVGEVVLKFLIALLITFSLGRIDKLVLFAAMLLAVTLIKQMISRIYAMTHFEECKLKWYWNAQKFWEMFTFAGWSFLGKTSGTFAGQGVNMIVNVVFGPAVNAARQLTWTVIHSVQLFVNNFTMAIWPQVAQSYASGEHGYMMQLLIRGAKFSYFIMWIIVLPLFLETEFVVGLWLGKYPDHTISFIRLALIANILDVLEAVLAMGIRATGKIKWYQISFSLLEFAYFGVVFILMRQGFIPEWTMICSIFIVIFKTLTIMYLCHRQLEFSIISFIKEVLFKVTIVTGFSMIITWLIATSMPTGFIRFVIVLLSSLAISSLCILFIGCTSPERKMLLEIIQKKIHA